jgi:hypothetical protein
MVLLKRSYGADIYFDKVKKQQISVVDCIAIRMRDGKCFVFLVCALFLRLSF